MAEKMMEVVVGSYEEVLVGLRLNCEDGVYRLTETFTEKVLGSVRCVATSQDGLLASGGTDEMIRIFNLKNHRLVGTLTHHSGTVTSLQFQDSHLFSTSEDGTLCLWRVANWEPERTFKGHKGPVKHAAVHPSGKMTLTIGQDKTLRLWNNMTGRIAYISNLKEPAELVAWSPDGLHYVVTYRSHMDVYSVQSKGLLRTFTTAQRINSIKFISDSVIAYGGEGKMLPNGERETAILFFTSILEGDHALQVETKCNRIRDLAVCQCIEEEKQKWLTLVGSDGTVNMYLVNTAEENTTAELMTSRNISLRLTSVTVSMPQLATTKKSIKKKRKLQGTDDVSTPKLIKNEDSDKDTSEPSPKVVKKKVKINELDLSQQKKSIHKDKKKKKALKT